ncbi:MAG: hypothetical protein H6R04_1148 [Burkholderiaceae bacterium]|nr:hypothetical protein [Burkholderiaceae bacterium]
MATRLTPLLILLLIASTALGAETRAEAEIDALLTYVERSGCEFYRNGEWHTATDASTHLRKKYRYLQQRDLVPDANAFIARAATASSISGKPYQVRCSGAAPVESAPWLKAMLERQRKSAR